MKFTLTLFTNFTKVNDQTISLQKSKQLPSFLHEVAIGQLLGDASCTRSSITSNSRME